MTVAKAAAQGLYSWLSWSFGSSAAGEALDPTPGKGCGDAAPDPAEAETTVLAAGTNPSSAHPSVSSTVTRRS